MSDWFTYWKVIFVRNDIHRRLITTFFFNVAKFSASSGKLHEGSFYLRNYGALASTALQIKNVISPLGKEACCTYGTHFRTIPRCRFSFWKTTTWNSRTREVAAIDICNYAKSIANVFFWVLKLLLNMNWTEWMKGICHEWAWGRHFSPSRPGDTYLKLSSQ